MRADRPRHILIVRMWSTGATAAIAPAVRALCRSHPGAAVTVLAKAGCRPFFRDAEGVGFVACDDPRHSGARGFFRMARHLAGLRVTHIADLHNVFRSRLLSAVMWLIAGARSAAVDRDREGMRLLTRKFRKGFRPLRPFLSRCCDTVRRLGFELADPEPEPRAPRAVPGQIVAVAGEPDGRWVGIAPFARTRGCIYPVEHTSRLIELLAGRFSRVFVFGGSLYEQQFARLMEQRHERVVSVQGRVDLDGEMDLISNLAVMVTMDSTPMHIASLAGARVVSVWGATHPYAGHYGFGQQPDDAVQLDMPCRPCSGDGSRRCIYRDYRCLGNIGPEAIEAKMKRRVQSKPGKPRTRPASAKKRR